MIKQQQKAKAQTSTQQNLSILFKGTKEYQEHRQHFRSLIRQNNQKAIFSIVKVLIKTLNSDRIHPFSKLLAVRFFRESINCISYGFLALASLQLTPLILQIALFDKESQDQERGRKMFSHIQQQMFIQNANQLQVVGFSLHKLSLQIIVMLEQWMPYCPYHKFPIPSVFSANRKILTQQNVKIASSFSYFKAKDTERFLKQYNQRTQNSKLSEKDVSQFYDQIFKKLQSPNRQQYNQYLQTLKGLLNSGDMYCAQYTIAFFKKLLNKKRSQQSLKKDCQILHELLMQVDYQFIESFEQEILQYFIEYVVDSKQNLASSIGKQIMQKMWIWGFLLKNDANLDTNGRFKRLWICLSRYSVEAQKTKQMLIKLQQKKQKKRQLNELKMKCMKWKAQNFQTLDKNLFQLETVMNKTQVVRIQYESQALDEANSSALNFDSKTDPKKMLNYKLKVNNAKNGQKRASSELKGGNRQAFHLSNTGPSFIQKLRQGINFNFDYRRCAQDVKVLKSMRKKTEPRSSIKLQSCPNLQQNRTFRYSQSEKGIYSEKSLLGQGDNYERRIKQLEQRVLRSEKKQKQYESLLQEKQLQIRKVSITPKSQARPNSLIKVNHVQMAPKIKEKTFIDDSPYLMAEKQYQSQPGQSRASGNSKKAKSIEQNVYVFSLKTKKQILKNKILLLKNSDMQIGLITVSPDTQSQKKISVNIYVTPLKQFHSIAVNIKHSQWCCCNILSNKQKQKVKPSIQYIINTQFILIDQNSRNFRTRFQSLPELQISSSIGSRLQSVTMVLPIFISKFFIHKEIQQKDCQKIPLNNKNKNIFRSEPKKIEQKIFKSFDNFLKYFPNSILVEDKTIYAFKINFENNQAIIVMKILDGQFMQIELSPTFGNDWSQNRAKLIKDAYYSLLTV